MIMEREAPRVDTYAKPRGFSSISIFYLVFPMCDNPFPLLYSVIYFTLTQKHFRHYISTTEKRFSQKWENLHMCANKDHFLRKEKI